MARRKRASGGKAKQGRPPASLPPEPDRPRICQVCGAEARGFAHKPPRGQTQLPVQHACSMACLDTIYEVAKRDGDMVDPTTEEENALLHGGAMGGDYLESLGKPGVLEAFAHLSRDEWRTFVECIVTGFQDNLRESVTQKYDRNAKQ